MKKIILLFGLLLSCFAFSQGENNNWYFGSMAGVTFNASPPTALTDSGMVSSEAVATISDSNSNLLFYTNGEKIWNRQHQVMENGAGLTGTGSTAQQVLILPHPGSANLYYVFTMSNHNDSQPTPSTKPSFSVVDMGEGGLGINGQPLGAVVVGQKNINLKNDLGLDLCCYTEAVTAVLHSDNQSYWVLVPDGTNLYSYRLDASGLINDPIPNPLSYSFQNFGSIKASPNLINMPYSNLISINNWSSINNKWHVYSFDNDTGTLTTHKELIITYEIGHYSAEFNSDGSLLYGAQIYGTGDILVIDMDSGDIKIVYSWETFNISGTLQRGVDNNIYFSKIPPSDQLYLISNPDSFADSSLDENNPNNIYLEGKETRYGLPQLIPLFCKDNLILSTPETNQNMVYKVSNTITTHQDYEVILNQDITLNAGNMIEILTDTHIKSGSIFRAMIEGCGNFVNRRYNNNNENVKSVRITINLDENEVSNLKVYPNPAKDVINIYNATDAIENVTITDMNGRVVMQVALGVNEGQINISDLSQGVYILNATSNGKSVTEKIVKK